LGSIRRERALRSKGGELHAGFVVRSPERLPEIIEAGKAGKASKPERGALIRDSSPPRP
jgi:hypothetical protein